MPVEISVSTVLAVLQAAHPGRVFLPLKEACFAVGISPKTYHNHHSIGLPQFPSRRVGGKIVASIFDLAAYAAGVQAGETHRPRSERNPGAVRAGAPKGGCKRHGRPTRVEQNRAQEAGLTVAQLRALEAGEGAQ